MAKKIISNPTLRTFQEYLVAYSVLREIEVLFEDAGIFAKSDYNPAESSVRRQLIQRYYASVNLEDWSDVKKLLAVFEVILIEAIEKADEWYGDTEDIKQHVERMKKYLQRDGFVFENNQIVQQGNTSLLLQMVVHAEQFDAKNLHAQIKRIESSIDSDPWLAIGTAKELIETTCKTILEEQGKTVDSKWDLPKLVKETRQVLKLTPDDIPNSAKAAQTIKILLSNLATVTQGLAELRNSYGTGHGPEGRRSGLQVRHARLAVGAATTLAVFLFDTHLAEGWS